MTKLEEVVGKTDAEISDYLCEVSIDQFRKDVEEIKTAYVNQQLLVSMIETLEKLKK
jgi:hypothetical protein